MQSVMLFLRPLVATWVAIYCWTAEAQARDLVAIIEEASATISDVSILDLLNAGQTIRLGTHEQIVVGYFRSCQREIIVRGTVRIGLDRSEVEDGAVSRRLMDCDGRHLLLTDDLADKSEGFVFRKPGGTSIIGVDLTIYGTSPLFLVNTEADSLVLERLDRADDRVAFAIEDRHVDLAKTANTLARGGLYRAEAGGHSTVFRVDSYARPDVLSAVSRLVPL